MRDTNVRINDFNDATKSIIDNEIDNAIDVFS
jgi:hypothetical protein